jgi:hypothetical protein
MLCFTGIVEIVVFLDRAHSQLELADFRKSISCSHRHHQMSYLYWSLHDISDVVLTSHDASGYSVQQSYGYL